MIHFTHGNIFTVITEALVNPVNCKGVMGAGLALAFKQRYPKAFVAYAKECHAGRLVPGRIFTFYPGGPVIMHFPTKRHYADRSKLEDIKIGLAALATEIKAQKIRSIAIPALGCGLGGLAWSDVKPLIEDALGPLTDVRIIVFEPE